MNNVIEIDKRRFGVSKKELNVPFLTVCAIFFVLGTVLSMLSVLSLLIPSVAKELLLTVEDSGVQNMESLIAWFAVCVGIRVFFALFCGIYASGLVLVLAEIFSENSRLNSVGWRIISAGNRVARWIWITVCVALGAVFAVRFVPYFISNINNHEGVFYIAGLFLYEGMCLTFFCLIAYMLFRCFGALEDSADCMSYMFTSCKVCQLPPTSYAFLFVLSLMSLIFAGISRGDIFVAITLFVDGAAFLLTAVWFKRLKSRTEWIKYQEEKKNKLK